MKRAFDFCWSLVCLILFSPLFIACYIAVRLEDGGPAFFRQERIGKGGKPFNILKFRSMTTNGHRDEYALFKHEKNENLTRVGRFLRDHHLDELPQLWNVLIGDMSLVGPRPERQYFIERIMAENSDYEYIFLMRPGCTSLATIYNGYTDTMEKMLIRLQMDLDYLQKRSLWLDIKVLATTFEYMVFGKKF